MSESDRGTHRLSTAERLGFELWSMLGGDPQALDRLRFEPGQHPGLLPSVYDVGSLASACVGVATLAVAELGAARSGGSQAEVSIDPVDAAAAFRSEALLEPLGWTLPPIWDPIAGVYAGTDGFIRLHTNYAHHRAAALSALGLADDGAVDRDAVAHRVATFAGAELESQVVAAGGCAAVMYDRVDWADHEHGRVAIGQQPVVLDAGSAPADVAPARLRTPGERPLAGLRVLDVTRVIAGPVATRTLAAWGADVLRIDPPGFAEVPAALPDMVVGKRCAAVDLKTEEGASTFARLVAEADVVVHGLRPGALAGLGLGEDGLHRLNPAAVSVAVDAYGWDGPWAGRRGFDSLVQFSAGIAAESGTDGRPGVLPAQALDHGTGYLLAAAACRGLVAVLHGAERVSARGALIGSANLLIRQQLPGPLAEPQVEALRSRRQLRGTAWGDVLAVPQPGLIDGVRGVWREQAGPLGRHAPVFG